MHQILEDQLLEIVQEHIYAFNDGDEDRFSATLTDDAVMAFRAVDRVFRGVDDIRAVLWALRDQFSDVHLQVTNAFVGDSSATVEVIRSGTSTLNGVRVTVPECLVYTIRQGKIATISYYTDRMTELVQSGAAVDVLRTEPEAESEMELTPEPSTRPWRTGSLLRAVGKRSRPSVNP